MSQATRVRLLWPVLLLTALLFSSWSPGRPEEPAGIPSSLQGEEVATDLPPSLSQWAGWHRKGDGFVARGDLARAVFCYHQAEDVYPLERPSFPEGSDWNEREWSGRPVRTYLAKALMYVFLNETEAYEYYLALGQSHREAPSDDLEIARVRATRAYLWKDFSEVERLLGSSDQSTDQLLVAVSAYKAGDKSRLQPIKTLREAIRSNPAQAYRQAWLPAELRLLVEGLK